MMAGIFSFRSFRKKMADKFLLSVGFFTLKDNYKFRLKSPQ